MRIPTRARRRTGRARQGVGGSTATNLTNVTMTGRLDHNITMVVSPDATHVAAIGAFGTLDGSGMRAIGGFAATCTTNSDYTRVDWTADGKYVCAVGDALINNDTQLYRLDRR